MTNDIFIFLQVIGIFILVAELIYIMAQKPSNLQKILGFLTITCIFSFVSYYFELRASTEEGAYFACVMGYVSKPFSLLSILMFLAEYAHIKIKKSTYALLLSFYLIMSLIVFTNELHHMYYTSVSFSPKANGSGLTLGHGIFWYLYMLSSFLVFIAYAVIAFQEYKKSTTRQAKKMAFYVFFMLFCGILGLALFVCGFTGGFDTTLSGTFAGALVMLLLLVRYRLFDSLTLAKEKLMSDSNDAVVVLDGRLRVSYFNSLARTFVSKLGNSNFDDKEIVKKLDLYDRNNPILKNERAYSLIVNEFYSDSKGVLKKIMIGKTYEFKDITDQYLYQNKLQSEVLKQTSKIINIQRDVLSSFANLIEARDGCTGSHVKNVSKYVRRIAIQLSSYEKYEKVLDRDTIKILEECAPLHDVGKIIVSDTILQKPGKLTEEEYEKMKLHANEGANIIDNILGTIEDEKYLKYAKDIANYHHEWFNGQGYPHKLKGDEIPLSARIMAVADVYDALRTVRPYKGEFTKEESINIIKNESGTHFDPDVVQAFLDICDIIED